ncbi:multifunctional expression regulator [Saimiriine alphaherpesvirus 1]|uniref:Multifunctional expression regulator n=1 Tax=Saimiriine herpesvirus 1 (strain MV-5-4-PSL) TaxID=10353 RepID=E2IUB6_SHV1|nr:multifunctional expression regulator [Saimiriine alphaherpesvirus 1]ADO13774.1 multifunctional expression regulator [Saimiriine alphaherpesvirus 1]
MDKQYIDLGLDLSDSDLDCEDELRDGEKGIRPESPSFLTRRSPAPDGGVSSADLLDDSESDSSELDDGESGDEGDVCMAGSPNPKQAEEALAPVLPEAHEPLRSVVVAAARPEGVAPSAADRRPESSLQSGCRDRPRRRARAPCGDVDQPPHDGRPPRRRGGRRRHNRRRAAPASDAWGADDVPRPKKIREDYTTASPGTVFGFASAGHRTAARSPRDRSRPAGDLRDTLRSARGTGRPANEGYGDCLRANVLNSLETLSARVSAERVSESFNESAAVMRDPFMGEPFDATHNPWALALTPASGPYEPEKRRMSWDSLLAHGPRLHRLFEDQPRASATARALRECVLRNENLIEALASADEVISWCKMCVCRELPIRTRDPIIATAGAVLDNLRSRLAPFMRCYMRSRGSLTVADLCDRRRLSDARDVTSYVLILLARIAHAVSQGRAEIGKSVLGLGPEDDMSFYTPGACMAGTIEMLNTHKHECGSHICRVVASHTLVPLYYHGKYFYCNMLF